MKAWRASRRVEVLVKDGASWSWAGVRAEAGLATWEVVEVRSGPQAEAMGAVMSGRAGKGRRVTRVLVDLGLPLFVRDLRIPRVASRKQEAMLRAEIERALPGGLEEVVWDGIALGADAIEEPVLVLAARERDWAASRREFAGMGWPCRSETLPVAWLNLCRHAGVGPERAAVIVFVREEASWFVAAGRGGFHFRALEVGWAQERDPGRPRLRGAWRRALAAYQRQQPDWHPEAGWYAAEGVGADEAAVHALLEGILPTGTPVARWPGEPSIEGLDRVPSRHRLIVGGVLLGALQGGVRSHLRSTSEHDRPAVRAERTRWAVAAALLVAAGVGWWAAEAANLRSEQAIRRTLEAELAPLEAEARALAELEAAIAREEAAVARLARLGRARGDWTHLLADLQRRLIAIENVWIDVLQPVPGDEPGQADVEADGGADPTVRWRLHLQGRLLDPAQPLQRVSESMRERAHLLLEELEAAEHVRAVEDRRFEPLERGLLQFSFVLVIEPGLLR